MKHTITVTIEIPNRHPGRLPRRNKHPHDIASEAHGRADGLARIKEFIGRDGVMSELVELLWTYPDDDAEQQLVALRERFWTEDPATPFPKETT